MMKVSKALLLCAVLCLFACAGKAEEGKVHCPLTVTPYADTRVAVTVPQAGTLFVRAEQLDDGFPVFEGYVQAGETVFNWDGLLAWGEPMREGKARLNAELTTDSGGRLKLAGADFTVGRPLCRVQFALPYREEFAAPDPLWQVEIRLSAPGTLYYSLSPKNDPDRPLLKGTRSVQDAEKIEVIRWRGTQKNGANAPAGDYVFSCRTDQEPEGAHTFTVRVTGERAGSLPLEQNAWWVSRIPLSEEERDAFFSDPLPLVDAAEGSGIPVFEAKSANSARLGAVHGSTVSVNLLEPRAGNGWSRIGFYTYGDSRYQEGYIQTGSLTMVRPSGRYGLILDLRTQTMTVYERGREVGSLRVSTALSGLKMETGLGVYLTGLRIGHFRDTDYQYDYAIRVDKDNLMHQIGYRFKEPRSFADHKAALGTPASHGCIRMAETAGPDGQGLTAWWVYSHIPKRTVLLVVDDLAARTAQTLHSGGFSVSLPTPIEP